MRKQFGIYILPVIAICAVIFYQFPAIPPHLSYDEVSFARLALSLEQQPYAPYSPLATGHSTLYFYIILLSLKLFGVSALGLRLPSAVFGIVSVILFMMIMRRITKNDVLASISGLMMAMSRWYFNFARFSFEPTFLITLELASILFLLKALKSRRMSDALWCGLFAGLAFHSYYPGRLFFLLPLAFLLRYARPLSLYFAGAFLVVIMPLLMYYSGHPDIRITQLSVISDSRRTPSQKLTAIADNTAKTVGMFALRGDMNGRHNFPGKPALNPIASLFLIAGLSIAIMRIRKLHDSLFVAYFVLSLIPALLTLPIDNPSMLRTVTAIPAVIYFMTLPLMVGYRFAGRARVVILAVCAVLLTVSCLYELRTYFQFQARVVRNSFEVTCPLDQLMKEKTDFVPKRCRVSKNLF